MYLDAANTKSYPGSGTTWYDMINTADGVLQNGPTYNTDIKSFTFDGINDYTSFANQSQFYTPTFTVCAWVCALYFEAQGTNIFTLGDSNRLLLGTNYGTSGVPTGGIYFRVVGTSATLDAYTSLPTIVSLNNWYHYTFIVDLPGQNIKGYVNGVQAYSNTNNYGSDFLNGPGVYPGVLASRYGGGADQANIKISTFSFYNRILSTTEILQNYNALKGRFGL